MPYGLLSYSLLPMANLIRGFLDPVFVRNSGTEANCKLEQLNYSLSNIFASIVNRRTQSIYFIQL